MTTLDLRKQMKSKEWMRVVSIVAATTELVVGIPLTIATAQQLGRFSLLALGPIAGLALLVILAWPGLWQRRARMEAKRHYPAVHAAQGHARRCQLPALAAG